MASSSKYGSADSTDVGDADTPTATRHAEGAPPAKKKGGFSLSEIKKKPALTKLLLTAAKKVKEVRAKEAEQAERELNIDGVVAGASTPPPSGSASPGAATESTFP
jgi:hypothetical protein